LAGEVRWDVLTIGHLSRNRYRGESEDRAHRAPLCTTTLVRCEGGPTIVVDPGQEPERMRTTLRERAGIAPEDVDVVLLTHFHADHRVGVDTFPAARWLMAGAELRDVAAQAAADPEARAVLERLAPADEALGHAVTLFASPGHTPGHHSLLLATDQCQVVVAGDAVMTRDFFLARDYYFNTQDPGLAVETIDRIGSLADVVVPGHDNSFLVRALPPRRD
jgi:glyoxylase-like metal-dependent hydrolase (beta-lactamase superfamily II)